MIEYIQLKQILAIKEYKTLSKAAEMTHISQPALSRSIQRMEEELEVSLFTREKNKLELNENGLLVIEYAQKILDLHKEMKNEVLKLDMKSKVISVAGNAPAPLEELKPLLNKYNPSMQIETQLDNELLFDKLNDDTYDLIISNEKIDNPFIECIPFVKEELYLSLPLTHPFSTFKDISFDKINGQTVLMLSQIGVWYDISKKHLPDSLIILQDDPNYLNELREASSIPTFATNVTVKYYKEENRMYIPISDDDAKVDFYIIYKKKNRHLFNELKESLI